MGERGHRDVGRWGLRQGQRVGGLQGEAIRERLVLGQATELVIRELDDIGRAVRLLHPHARRVIVGDVYRREVLRVAVRADDQVGLVETSDYAVVDRGDDHLLEHVPQIRRVEREHRLVERDQVLAVVAQVDRHGGSSGGQRRRKLDEDRRVAGCDAFSQRSASARLVYDNGRLGLRVDPHLDVRHVDAREEADLERGHGRSRDYRPGGVQLERVVVDRVARRVAGVAEGHGELAVLRQVQLAFELEGVGVAV